MEEYRFREMETKRLSLIKISEEHLDDMYSYCSDRKTTRYMSWPRHKSKKQTAHFIDISRELYEGECHYDWAIWHKEASRMIGTIGLSNLDREANGSDLGYIIDKTFWGQGLVPEACRALLDFCFNTMGFDVMKAYCDVKNKNSERVMQKLGMTYGGVKPYQLIKKKKPVPHKWYYIERN